jgi:hypothetical protein
VHTAPGHGREDYDVGLQYGLDAYSPVNDNGVFTDEVGRFAGQFVFKANDNINQTLADKGALLAKADINHSYPHCWRCKRPVIFRATPQWFISMEKTGLRKKSLQAIDRVKWIPHWGRERIYRHDRKPAGLVRFPPAGLGRSHYGFHLRKLRCRPHGRSGHEPCVRPVCGTRGRRVV